jgi:hypothetical protein
LCVLSFGVGELGGKVSVRGSISFFMLAVLMIFGMRFGVLRSRVKALGLGQGQGQGQG